MNHIARKIAVLIKTVRIFKNWLRIIAYHLGLLPGPMTMVFRDGTQFKIRDHTTQPADRYVVNESYLYKIHEAIIPLIKNAKIGFDIGAHIGAFSVYAAQRSPATIYAFEPVSDNFAILRENIAVNNLRERIIPIPAAVTNVIGTVNLFVPVSLGFASIFETQVAGGAVPGSGNYIAVPSVTLDSFFAERKIAFCDFIKMDCEGSEYSILYNTPFKIFKRIRAMTIECHAAGDMNNLMRFLSNRGFLVTKPAKDFGVIFCERRPPLSACR